MISTVDIELAISLLRAGQPLPPQLAELAANTLANHAKPSECFTFAYCDGGWMIGEAGNEVFHLTKKSGYRFIQTLLKNPNKAIHCTQVYHDCTLTPQDIEAIYFDADKARVNVQKRIKSALNDIPGLIGKHLRASIATGFNCGYYPHITPTWTLAH